MLIGWAWKEGGRLTFTDPVTDTCLVIRLLDRVGDAEPRIVVEPLEALEPQIRMMALAHARARMFTQACVGCRTVTEGAHAVLRFVRAPP